MTDLDTSLIAPENYNIVMEFEKYAKETHRKALILEDDLGNKQEMTYENLINNANRIGNIFLTNNLKKGDKLLVMMPRMIETYEIYIAALKIGVVIIPCSEMLRTKDLEYRISHGEVKGIVSVSSSISQFNDIPQYDQLIKFSIGEKVADWYDLIHLKNTASIELDMVSTTKDDLAFLPYTSGTTGNPKAVMHTHAWGYAHMRTAPKHWLAINEHDIVWATAAPGWQKWVWSPFLSVLGTGATGFIFSGKYDPEKYLNLIEKYEVNVFCCTPTEYRLMAKLDHLEDYNLRSIHSAVSAGEPLNREVIDQFKKYFDITVREGYGQTKN